MKKFIARCIGNSFFSGLQVFTVCKSVCICYLFLLASCSSNKSDETSNDRQAMIDHIDSLQQRMFNPQSMELDKTLTAEAVTAYLNFVEAFPGDSARSAEYLFQLSDLSRAMADNRKAIEYLDQICKNYPSYKRIPECLFLQGYYYQDFFGDTVRAKEFYTELIAKYPAHGFVDDAQALLKTFGKTDRDIIKEFEKKNKEEEKIN